ncbi:MULTISPECIES: hypothetical protein [Variovorax]|uniref:Uncharacterized protein n=2 Tax=Variovorax boronicumulans TaxID=436515 RepID=A0A250DE99_9BURK|nr:MULTISPECIES: hypothetical protein [Variovorax]ATA52303.1 hypothetical protein CKY39_02995 [Variovorax boronicumulans]MDP9918888.1 hypothetical protein [Variovorax boronicumulans]PBI82802.1 hypothetical protein BKP43_63130 [Variovorax boronicumulans]TSD57193.1 hypothetical protein FFI97_023950 [Variovorax sp. KBS0712]GER13418.1 hypothetical protein VHAB30_46080 [Variovorax boronicumulans]
MQETLSSAESSELVRLWRRRQTLSSDDMGTMYRIVGDALVACNPPELQVLGEGRQELVAQFIYVKVLRLDADPDESEERAGHSAPSTAFALCAYFRRYLIDCTRASSFRRKVSIGDQITEAQLEDELGPGEDLDGCLAEHGLSAQAVQLAARAFIAGLPEPERILLCEGFGQEAEGGLSGVASRHAIASYHYRAGRLGLVHKREGLGAGYAQTRIGSWIGQTLGIAIEADNMAAILQVFKILGAEASYV